MERLANYVNGELAPPAGGEYLDNVDPATGSVYSLAPDSGPEDVEAAVAAARRAFPAWSSTPAEERAAILLAVSARIERDLEELALVECVDTGKPLALARSLDIPRAASNFRFFAHAATQFSSEAHVTDVRAVNYTRRDPLGVVGCISPWNLPLYLFTWKIAPALAAGNAVVAKPSEVTPATAFRLSGICREEGVPPGVLNILHGLGPRVGAPLVSHPEVKAISFTGGTATGAEIARTAAPMFKKLSLELGGKNPAIVFADCDFEETVAEVARAAFANQGQVCLCGSRILVERAIYESFRDAIVAEVGTLTVGDPLEPETRQGALVSGAHLAKVLSYVDLAREEGGEVLTGGTRIQLEGRCADGFFMAPTLIDGLSPECRTNQEEIFGPVATLIPFDGEAEAVRHANCTPYGLAATVFSRDVDRCHRVARDLDCGIVWVNGWLFRDLRTPFGGTKSSGVGREGGLEALRFFTEPKNVCVRIRE
jgi:aminomuconate-semialdehyde/2-hydroxymuconate-6-semialdehyde dehydrogenase